MTILAQAAEVIPGGFATVAFGYGPLGIFCWWLTRLVERQRREITAKDQLVRDAIEKHVEAMGMHAHKIDSLTRGLVYNAATYGPPGVRELAQAEVARWDSANEAAKK